MSTDILNLGEQRFNFTNLEQQINEFMQLYDERPIKNNAGGMLSTHLFWTWYTLKELQPKYIIEM